MGVTRPSSALPALTEQLQQQHEEIDEVEIKRERSEHGLLAGYFERVRLQIQSLDALRVLGGQTNKHEDADDGYCELKGA